MDQNNLPNNRPPRTITNKTTVHSLSVMCKARGTPQAIGTYLLPMHATNAHGLLFMGL